MIRLAGGLLVIASASLFGFRAADALEEEYRQMQDLRRIVYMLQGEIRYARSFLSEAFLTIALDQEEPLCTFYPMCHQIEKAQSFLFHARNFLSRRNIHQYHKEISVQALF